MTLIAETQPADAIGTFATIDSDQRTTTSTADALGTKRDVAKMLKMSVRSVDNYISAGCPVIKLSPRRCRFDMADVKAWFKTQYGQQRRA